MADTQTYYSLINRVREQSVSRRPGWTWTAWDDLQQAAALDVDPGGIADLTTLAVATRCSVDIRLKTTLDERRRIEAVAFHPDGRHLAMARTKGTPEMAVDLYDLQTLERVGEYRVPTLLGNLGRLFQGDRSRYQESFTCIAFSADEGWLAAGTRHGSVHCWDLTATGAVSQSLKAFPDAGVERLVFSADGKRLFAKPSKARGWRVWEHCRRLERGVPGLRRRGGFLAQSLRSLDRGRGRRRSPAGRPFPTSSRRSRSRRQASNFQH